jgi:hypothetical protein
MSSEPPQRNKVTIGDLLMFGLIVATVFGGFAAIMVWA